MTLVDKVITHWPEVLWGGLITALGLNIAWLLWPQPPETLVISPHPTALEHYEAPVLVESSPKESNHYLLVRESRAKNGEISRTVQNFTVKQSDSKDKKVFNGKINLNKASLEDLQLLPGIGPKMAERILDYREQHGPFRTLDQLMEVPGIGAAKFEKLSSYCSL